jgi:ABC-2 type transport system permease protein
MNRIASVPFGGVIRAEMLYNAKRALPYALMLLFSANALLWWGWGPAVARGWAVNGDFYVSRMFVMFSFMTLPLFIALVMGDVIARDFEAEIDTLIFSKPLRRLEYIAGKFLGNFLVLVCCEAAFAVTFLALQGARTQDMIVVAPRVMPFLQHFLFFTVLSSLPLAALFFAVGALTRNVKLVYGTTIAFYCVYTVWQIRMREIPLRWRIALDPLLMNFEQTWRGYDAPSLNQVTVTYDRWMLANRAAMLVVAIACIAVVNLRFSTARLRMGGSSESLSIDFGAGDLTRGRHRPRLHETSDRTWLRAIDPWLAALTAELRLLRHERSFGLVAALTLFGCLAGLAAFPSSPAAYATRTVDPLLLFLFAISLFYTGEAFDRDRALRVKPLLWSTPISNAVLVLAKITAVSLVGLLLIVLVGVGAAIIQLLRGSADGITMYGPVYGLILLPSLLFMVSASAALHSIAPQKHLAHAAGVALAGAFYSLVAAGMNHPSFNLLLFGVWSPESLTERWLLAHRLYTVAVAAALTWIAIRFLKRKV